MPLHLYKIVPGQIFFFFHVKGKNSPLLFLLEIKGDFYIHKDSYQLVLYINIQIITLANHSCPKSRNILVHPTYLTISIYTINTKYYKFEWQNIANFPKKKYQDSLSFTILIVSGTSTRYPTALQKFFNNNVTFNSPKASFG